MSKKENIKIPLKKEIELNIICSSLIGKKIEIVDSLNKNQIGINGILLFESANLFFLKNSGGEVIKILKKGTLIKVEYSQTQIYEVDSSVLNGNLLSRIKKIK